MKGFKLLIVLLVFSLLLPIGSVSAKEKKIVYLTFDDGPSQNTPKVLKVLKKYHVVATFFVTAQEPAYFKYMKKAYQMGNGVEVHTYSHDYKKIYSSTKAFWKDHEKMNKIVKAYTGHSSKIFRFPGGASNTISRHYSRGIMKKLAKEAKEKGLIYQDWNVSSGDAAGATVPYKRIARNATKSGNMNHCVILMHDMRTKTTTVKALPKIIKYYKKHGYAFRKLSKSSFQAHQHINN